MKITNHNSCDANVFNYLTWILLTDKNRLDGYAINITQLLNPLETWQCYKDTENGWPTNLTPSHNCSSLGRYVKFSRERSMPDSQRSKAVINLCELEVYGKVDC